MPWIKTKQEAHLFYLGIGIIKRINKGSPFEKVMFEQRLKGSESVRHSDMQGKFRRIRENGKFKHLG